MLGKPKTRNPKGSWQTTRVLEHLRRCPKISETERPVALGKTVGAAEVQRAERMTVAASVAKDRLMPVEDQQGSVSFALGGFKPSRKQHALAAIANTIFYASTPPPDSFVEDAEKKGFR